VHICVAAGELVEDMNISTHYTKQYKENRTKERRKRWGCPKNSYRWGLSQLKSPPNVSNMTNFTTF
jgi:hypothetical protein